MATTGDQTVLIVEDEQSMAELHAHHLKSADYDVRTATSGGEALVELDADVDLVLLDRRMPGMSGDELLGRIHSMENECRVIVVSAIDPDLDIIDMPLTGYLTKPVEQDELLDAVKQAFLLDEYQLLLSKYYEYREKRAKLLTEFSDTNLQDKEQFTELEDQIESLKMGIKDRLEEFPNDELKEAFDEIHNIE